MSASMSVSSGSRTSSNLIEDQEGSQSDDMGQGRSKVARIGEEVLISSCIKITDSGLSPLAGISGLTGLPSVKILEKIIPAGPIKEIASFAEHCSLAMFAVASKNCRENVNGFRGRIKSLKIERGDVSSKESLIGLLKVYPNLEKLDLSLVRDLVDDDVLKQVAKLTQLTSLNLEGCEEITDLAPLADMTQLTSLDLGWCTQITDEGLAAFRAARPDVKIIR